MTDMTNTALIPLPAEAGEIALPAELIERTKDYIAEALSGSVRLASSGAWPTMRLAWAFTCTDARGKLRGRGLG